MDNRKRAILSLSFFTVACLGIEEPNISSTLITPECFDNFDCSLGPDDLSCMVPTCSPFTFTCELIQPDYDRDGSADMYCGGNDCDDGDDYVFPDGIEVCDNVDNNCDGEIDENLDCNGIVATNEVCDGLDNDLDGRPDDHLYVMDGWLKTFYVGTILLTYFFDGYVYLIYEDANGGIAALVYSDYFAFVSNNPNILPFEEGRIILDIQMQDTVIYILASYITPTGRMMRWRAFNYRDGTYIDSEDISNGTVGSLVVEVLDDVSVGVIVASYTNDTNETRLSYFDINGTLKRESPLDARDVTTLVATRCDGEYGVLVLRRDLAGSVIEYTNVYERDDETSFDARRLFSRTAVFDVNFLCGKNGTRYLAITVGTPSPGTGYVEVSSTLAAFDDDFNPGPSMSIDTFLTLESNFDGGRNPYQISLADSGFSLGVSLSRTDRIRFRHYGYNFATLEDGYIDIGTDHPVSGPVSVWINNYFAIVWSEDETGDFLQYGNQMYGRRISCED